MNTPILSVIIPMYNVAAYLPTLFNSLNKQKKEGVEVIFINDGSKDKTEELTLDFVKKHENTKYYSKINGGLSDTRNFGLEKVMGEYVYFLDADDWISENFFEVVLRNIETTQADCYVCDVEVTDGKIVEEYRQPWMTCRNETELIDKNLKNKLHVFEFHPIMQNKIFRRSILAERSIRFLKGLHYEDVAFFVDVYTWLDTIYYIKDIRFYYFQRAGSIMKTVSPKLLDIEKIGKYILESHQTEEYKFLVLRHILLASTRRAFLSGDRIFFNTITKSHQEFLETQIPNWKSNKYLRQRQNFQQKKQYFYTQLSRILGYKSVVLIMKIVIRRR